MSDGMQTIEAPATGGTTLFITGEIVGDFLVHASERSTDIGDDLEIHLWTASLRRNGLRFPFWFLTEEAAKAFCVDIASLMDWSATQAEMVEGGPKTRWTAGKPTSKQRSAVRSAALARGGLHHGGRAP